MAKRALHPAVAWAVVRDEAVVITLRWRRGDPVAYVLAGVRIGHYGTDALATIPVQRGGWTDLGQVRSRAQAWLTERRRDPTPKG